MCGCLTVGGYTFCLVSTMLVPLKVNPQLFKWKVSENPFQNKRYVRVKMSHCPLLGRISDDLSFISVSDSSTHIDGWEPGLIKEHELHSCPESVWPESPSDPQIWTCETEENKSKDNWEHEELGSLSCVIKENVDSALTSQIPRAWTLQY